MEKAILVDKQANGVGLKKYLVRRSADFADVQILDKNEVFNSSVRCKDIKYLFSTWNMPVLSESQVRDYFPSLDAIFYAAGDTTYFSDPFAKRGVTICCARIENSVPVAEFVLGQVLLANKGYFQAQDVYRRELWFFGFKKARKLSQRKIGNNGATVGIIGFGAVGSLVASMLRTFDFKVVVHDPFVDDEKIQDSGVVRVDLDELFATSDVITNHLPDIEETRGLLNYSYFSSMKSDATFINTGRGRQVEESGLARAMRESPSRTALLDVTGREPVFPFSPLFRLRNVFLSPHIAGSQGQEIERLYQAAFQQFLDHKES